MFIAATSSLLQPNSVAFSLANAAQARNMELRRRKMRFFILEIPFTLFCRSAKWIFGLKKFGVNGHGKSRQGQRRCDFDSHRIAVYGKKRAYRTLPLRMCYSREIFYQQPVRRCATWCGLALRKKRA
jgi:hypothetical protein